MTTSGDEAKGIDREGSEATRELPATGDVPETKVLSEAAKRALAEAEARRSSRLSVEGGPQEQGGRSGPDPVRYGDWENKGIASDF